MTPPKTDPPTTGCIELRDFKLLTRIGTYGPGETVPEHHALDLTLWISPELVLIAQDGMAHVFDYDPLVLQIEHLAADGHYATQERLMTRIVQACAQYPAIEALEIALRKFPVRPDSGSLGVRLRLGQSQWLSMRSAQTP
ncbi:dihydroneopterin aldolase [Limnohabitans sp.]|jgi:dihydroneopterin aldolase|uniref:dihydroneopterin aldolase n=1 Tax=Limnohabitans sp. TaxID=1907725 RepID=UPI0037BF07DC